jgi:hypothetical protein
MRRASLRSREEAVRAAGAERSRFRVPGNKWLGDGVGSREMSGSEQGKGKSNADAVRRRL